MSRFTKASIFSGINNLNDISEDPSSASLLGYTQKELEDNFNNYINEIAIAQKSTYQKTLTEMKKWYNGYRFSEVPISVYNPFSILYYLDKQKCRNYWFSSETPTFLMKLLKEKRALLKDFSGAEVTENELSPFEIDNIPLIPLLYQTGYLTIVDAFLKGNTRMYRLAYPNTEVSESLSRCILSTLTKLSDSSVVSACIAIRDAFDNNDIADVCRHMQILFANIPYQLHLEQEAYYHSLFLLALNLSGFTVCTEESTSLGSIDIVITTVQRIFVIEFKLNSPAKKAMNQIQDRRYFEKYLGQRKPITLVAITFRFKNKKLNLEWAKEDAV